MLERVGGAQRKQLSETGNRTRPQIQTARETPGTKNPRVLICNQLLRAQFRHWRSKSQISELIELTLFCSNMMGGGQKLGATNFQKLPPITLLGRDIVIHTILRRLSNEEIS